MPKVAVVCGLGSGGIGDACARRWSKEGYKVAMLARTESKLKALSESIPNSYPYVCDATSTTQIHSTIEKITKELGPIDALIYNAGSGVFSRFDSVSQKDFDMALATGPKALFAFAKALIPGMLSLGGGTIAVTGATASWRGMPETNCFAPAKFAQRALAQSLCREFGPQGIHVFHVVIDGMVDIPRTRAMLPDAPDELFLQPDAIADTFWFLANQDPSARSFETSLTSADRQMNMLTI